METISDRDISDLDISLTRFTLETIYLVPGIDGHATF